MKLDILAFAAHPDDVELAASGSVIKHVKMGYKVGVVDLTRGELGTRGSAELRDEEAKRSSEILGLTNRHNLKLKDGLFEINEDSLTKVIEQIRRFKPDVIWCNAVSDRHPDHSRGSQLVSRACFLSGLRKYSTLWEGQNQEVWRPKAVYHYIQDHYLEPDFIIDVTNEWDERMKSVMAFSSQFYNPDSNEPASPISGKEFLPGLEGRARNFGRLIGAEFGEGFTVERPLGVRDVTSLS